MRLALFISVVLLVTCSPALAAEQQGEAAQPIATRQAAFTIPFQVNQPTEPGRQPTEWITVGDVHRQSVVDGPIEVLDAGSLPPGDYILRLVLVKNDGNFLNPPHSVPIRIGPE